MISGAKGYELEPGITIPSGIPGLIVENSLVVADLHLGIESELASTGLYLPKIQLTEILDRIKRVFNSYQNLTRLVIAGDLKHRFDRLTWQEKREVESLILNLREQDITIVLVRGNHDTFLRPLLERLGVHVEDCCFELTPSVMVTHGHMDIGEEYLDRYQFIVMGHEHPVYQARIAGATVGRFQVFLKIPTNRKATLLVLPAFGVYQSGNPISLDRNGYLSPIIRKYGEVERAIPIVIEEEMVVELPQLYMLLT